MDADKAMAGWWEYPPPLRQPDFGLGLEPVLEMTGDAGDGGGVSGLGGEGLVEQLGGEVAIGRGELGPPLLFHRITLVPEEAIERLEPDDVGSAAGGEGGEGIAQKGGNRAARFVGHGVAA